jgi:hypothetical protein
MHKEEKLIYAKIIIATGIFNKPTNIFIPTSNCSSEDPAKAVC